MLYLKKFENKGSRIMSQYPLRITDVCGTCCLGSHELSVDQATLVLRKPPVLQVQLSS